MRVVRDAVMTAAGQQMALTSRRGPRELYRISKTIDRYRRCKLSLSLFLPRFNIIMCVLATHEYEAARMKLVLDGRERNARGPTARRALGSPVSGKLLRVLCLFTRCDEHLHTGRSGKSAFFLLLLKMNMSVVFRASSFKTYSFVSLARFCGDNIGSCYIFDHLIRVIGTCSTYCRT